jgi:Predicted thioesterase involved in non-ribosomal peptide biosynthesis
VWRLNGTPAELLENAELWQLIVPSLRADFELCETYASSFDRPLECPLLVLGDLQDATVRPNDLTAWRPYTRGSFELRIFDGDHFFLETLRVSVLEAVGAELETVVQKADVKHAPAKLKGVEAEAVVADKGYDADWLVGQITAAGAQAVIALRQGRTQPREYDRHLYKNRNLVERFFNRIKQFRRIATRYEKLAGNFLARLDLVCAYIWLA